MPGPAVSPDIRIASLMQKHSASQLLLVDHHDEIMEEVISEYHIPDVEEIANGYDECMDETESESE